MTGVVRLARVVLNARDVDGLSAFYVDALGFERRAGDDACALMLGSTRLDLREGAGRGDRRDAPGWSPLFQHCAIVVPDMAAAMERLRQSDRWQPISTDGPQTLPPNTGSVTAFKFRDPEGHPLEFLAFPDHAPVVARIDHSAISVADVDRSIAFYEDLGLQVSGRSLNVGPEQQRLDAIADAEVDVVSLALPGNAKPHLELLGYRGAYDRAVVAADPDDVIATRLVFTVPDAGSLDRILEHHAERRVGADCLSDPDGHLLQFEIAQ